MTEERLSAEPTYLLSVHGRFADTGAFNEALRRGGHFLFAGALEPATTATTVDGQGGRPALTDGPYLEPQDCLDGFWVIEAADLDVALALAAEGSRVCRGPVEVRPLRTAEPVRALPEP